MWFNIGLKRRVWSARPTQNRRKTKPDEIKTDSKHTLPDRFAKIDNFFSTDRFKPQNEKIKCQNNDFWDLIRSVEKKTKTSHITSTYENLLTALQDLRTLGIFSSDLHKWKDLSRTFYKQK